jgi:hypothetical protein
VNANRAARVPDLRRAVDVALDQVHAGCLDRRSRNLVGVRRLADQRLDLPVGGRDDLNAAVEVDLVTVVRWRVVRSRDLDARARAEMVTTERHHRRGHSGEHQRHHESLSGEDFGCGERELLRAVAGVAADDDVGSVEATFLEHLGHGPTGPQNDGEVHAARPGAHRTSQTCRAKGERKREPFR